MPTDLPTRRVAADMERIFRPLETRTPPVRDAACRRPARRRRRIPLFAGTVMLVVCGISIGYGRDDRSSRHVPTLPSALVTMPPAAGTPRPVSSPVPVAQHAVASSLPTAPPPLAAVSSRTHAPVARLRPAVAIAADAPADGRCAPGSPEDHCIYQDVLAADAHLRRAYERATRAGVDPSRLAEIQRGWNRARRGADDDPDGTIDRYERLADALDEARR